MRLVYGAPPDPRRNLRRLDEALAQMPEEAARELRQLGERHTLGKALYNLIAPACGEEPLP